MKKLNIGLQASGKSRGVKITRANVAIIARKLPTAEKNILQKVFIERTGMKRVSIKAVRSLCAKGIIRNDKDLISNKPIYVLERGGQMVCRELTRKGKPEKPKTPHAVVKIDRHVFQKQEVAGTVQPNCGLCHKPLSHQVHVEAGKFLCQGLTPGMAYCFNEVHRQGDLCADCKKKAEKWRWAEAIRMTPACPSCGSVKAIPPSSASSVDQKCYQRLPQELKHGLFRQHGEPEHIFRERYPIALKAALDFLQRTPMTQTQINEQAKAMPR